MTASGIEPDPAEVPVVTDGGEETEGTDSPAVDDKTVVETAAAAAEKVIFSRYDRAEIRDIDVTVTYEEYQLEIDVYLDAPDDTHDPDQVADDAVLAARGAVDDLLL
jgi:hypothetical protein